MVGHMSRWAGPSGALRLVNEIMRFLFVWFYFVPTSGLSHGYLRPVQFFILCYVLVSVQFLSFHITINLYYNLWLGSLLDWTRISLAEELGWQHISYPVKRRNTL